MHSSPRPTVRAMRIVTWNLNHCKTNVRSRQLGVLESLNADLEVLTEPGEPTLHMDRGGVTLCSPALRDGGESWVVLRCKGPEFSDAAIPFEHMATAATGKINGIDTIVYGSVLPWRAAASHAPDIFSAWVEDVPSSALYGAWLTKQVSDLTKLRREHPSHVVIWAGDFNVPVVPPFRHHLPAGSQMLREALKNMGLRAWNAHCAHREAELRAIDLICGPAPLRLQAAFADTRTLKTSGLSDHPCYVVDVEISPLDASTM